MKNPDSRNRESPKAVGDFVFSVRDGGIRATDGGFLRSRWPSSGGVVPLLTELVEKAKSTELSDTDKKLSLLKYVVKTQQRMLRLNALAKWCKQVLSFLLPC